MQYLIKVKISQLSFYIPPNINIYSDFRRKSKLPSDGNPQFPQSKMSEIMGFTFSIHFDSINYKTILYNLQNQKYLTMRKTGWMQVRIVIENEKNLQIEKNQKSISVTLNALRKSGLRQQYACTIIDTVSLISQLSHKTGKKKSFTYPCTKNGQIIGQLKVKAIVQSKKQVQNSQLQSIKQKINIQKDAQDQNQRCGIVLSKRQIKVSLSQSTMQAIYFQDLSPIKKIQHNCIQKRVESEDQQQIMDALKENSVTMNIQKKFRQRETQQLQDSEASIDLLSKIDLLNRKFEDAQEGQNISEIYNLQGQGKHQEQNRDRKDSQLILSQSSERQPFIRKKGHDGIRQQQCWTQQSSFYSFRNSFSQDIS